MQLKKVAASFFAVMLSLLITASLIPADVFAEQSAPAQVSVLTGTNCSFEKKTLTVTGESFELPDGVGKSDVTSITISDGVTQMKKEAFTDFASLESVTVTSVTPPVLGNDVFDGAGSTFRIYVPSGAADTYKAADGWSTYVDIIKEMTAAPIEEAVNHEAGYNENRAAAVADDTWATHIASDFNGGDGSSESPYKIANAEQLALLAYNVNHGNNYMNQHFKLENDIDLSGYRWQPIGTYKWEKNGNSVNNSFSGSLDGNSKTIRGLEVDERTDKGCAGLFGFISGGTTPGNQLSIKNLTITDATIYSAEEGLQEAYSGILAGYAMVNDGTRLPVSNVIVSGTITNERTDGHYHSGGLIGDASRVDFTDCKADGINISGGTNTGGFVGTDADSTFTNCKATGSISGGWTLGGFVGYSTSSSSVEPSVSLYTKCSADVDVTGTDWQLGGFVGFLEGGKIKNSVAYGDVKSSVTGWEPRTGGFAGKNSGTIEHSYAEGTVSSSHQTIKPGGFIGYDEGGTTIKCMFDKTINSKLSAIGAVGTAGTNEVKEGTTQENKIGICDDILDGHTIDTTVWAADAAEHWHVCSDCGGKFEIASHTSSDWIIDSEPTETKEGRKYKECTICLEILKEEIIPAKDDGIEEAAPPKASTDSSSKAASSQKVNTAASPKTGDTANAIPYLSLLLLSGCVAGVFTYRKRKSL